MIGNAKRLISKKELLEHFGISYGALYRWKRKGLLPDDWFIRVATPTGQETFFPRDIVMERVELILKKKEDVLLDELRRQLDKETSEEELLVLDTVFGEKVFRMTDIKSIRVRRGEEETDLSHLIGENGHNREKSDG